MGKNFLVFIFGYYYIFWKTCGQNIYAFCAENSS